MPTIAIVNPKGGTGKSSTAVHLAVWLHRKQASCLLIDSDNQKSSSNWLSSLDQPINHQIISGTDVLSDSLPKLAEEHDWLVVDGPASFFDLTRAAILHADLALVPCQPTAVDLAGVRNTLCLIQQIQQIRNGEPKTALFLNQAIKRTRSKEEAAKVLGQIQEAELLKTVVHQRQTIADAFGQDATVFDLDGTSAGIAAREYKELFGEIMKILCPDARPLLPATA